MTSKLSVQWTAHLNTPEERRAFEERVRLAAPVLKVLEDNIAAYLRAMDVRSFREEDYESGSWAYKQAHRNGVSCLAEQVLKLTKDVTNPSK